MVKLKGYTPLIVSLSIHIGLIIYAHHVDSHPHKFGGLKYTDVDWRVVSDGAAHIFRVIPGQRAQGWLTRALHLPIGDPYERATFRYTPLLPLILSPTLIHPLLGKLVLSLLSLCVPVVLLSGPNPAGYWATHLLWTLNPVVLNITTRGSPEAIVLLMVVLTLYCLRQTSAATEGQRASISWKIYPVIYGITIWAFLAKRYGAFGFEVWRFCVVAFITMMAINGALWSIWGQPFLDHTYLYHLSRQDHRHNFSPYFYPIYLSLFPNKSDVSYFTGPSAIQTIMRHPLTSFIPQFGLVGLAGALLTPTAGVDMAFFIQTAIFVIFNKVCTSQYFVWFIPLLAPILPRLRISWEKAVCLVGAWILAQAVWLMTAFRLEFLGEPVYFGLWLAGLALLGVSTWVIGELLDAYQPRRHSLQTVRGTPDRVVKRL